MTKIESLIPDPDSPEADAARCRVVEILFGLSDAAPQPKVAQVFYDAACTLMENAAERIRTKQKKAK